MANFEELLKEGKLAETLMADEEFVEGAKKIFAEEKSEITDDKLSELMKTIEENCVKENILNNADCENISGGKLASAIIKTVTTTTGAIIGTIGGTVVGMCIGEHVSPGHGPIPIGGAIIGGPIGIGAGAVGGAVLGNKLGRWICENAGID